MTHPHCPATEPCECRVTRAEKHRACLGGVSALPAVCRWRLLLLLLLLAILPRPVHHHRQPTRQRCLYPAAQSGGQTRCAGAPVTQKYSAVCPCCRALPQGRTNVPLSSHDHLPLLPPHPCCTLITPMLPPPARQPASGCRPASSPLALLIILLGLVILKLLVAHAAQRHVLVPPRPRLRCLLRGRRCRRL